MNRTYKLIAVIGIIAMGLLIGKQATAQTTTSKIPFQGSLYDQGTPVNGTNEMVFSITAASWTETHSVQVVNGLYSVALGSVTPLPANLFTGVDSRQLAITVAGTSIGSVDIYKPFEGDIAIGTSGSITEDTDGTDTWSEIQLDNTNGKSTIISPAFMKLNNLNGNRAAQLYINSQGAGNLSLYNDFGVNTGWFGNQSNKGGLWQIIGDDGAGNSTGAILSGFWGGSPAYVMEDENARQGVTMSMETGGAADKSGLVMTWGPTTPNIEIRGKGWDNNELPTIQMFGEHTDGGSWYKSNAIFEVNSDGTSNWGNLMLQNSEEGGGRHETTVQLDGNDGSLTLRSPDGSQEFRINPNGFEGDVQTNGKFFASVVDGVENENITARIESSGDGDGATGWGTGSYNIGLRSDASNNVWGNVGLTGYAIGSVGFTNSGGTFFSQVDDGTTTVTNQGLYSSGSGPGVNYGIYAQASGGVENWAGWFEGNVMVNNAQLKLNNVNGNQAATLRLNAEGGGMLYTYNDFGSNTGWFGNYQAQGGFSQLAGYDGAGNITGAVLNGFWDGTGNARLMMEDENARQMASMNIDDGTGGKAGTLFTYGPNTPNLEMRGKGWEDNDLPTIQMFGQHTDGGSWYKSNTIMEVNSDGTANWGNLMLQNSEEGAGRHETTVQLDGSDGSLTLRSPDGSQEFRIDPNGISGGSPATDFPNINITDPGIMGGQGFASIDIINDAGGADPSGYSAELILHGTNTPNVQLGGKPWENNNLPYMNMFGSTSDGGSWFHSNLSMSVDTDGTYEAGNIGLQKTDITGQTAETTITLDGMNGNIGVIGSISANNFDLNNGVNGYVNMGAKTWEPTNGERRGFLHLSGTEDGLLNNDAQRVFLEVNDNGSGSYGTLGLKNYEDDGGGNGKVTIDLNGENGSIYLSSGAGDITLDGQNGNIGVNGDVSSNSMNTTNMNAQFFDASTQFQAGDFFGGTGTLMSSGGDIDATGNITAGGDVNATGNMNAVTFNTTSDKRYKKNISTIKNALSITEQLRGVTYNWRITEYKEKNFTNQNQVGLIAQEVEEVLPQLVHTDEEGMKSVNYSQMTAVLIEAVKELNAKVEALQGENAELKAELTKVELLEAKLKRFEDLLTGDKGGSNPSSLTASN